MSFRGPRCPKHPSRLPVGVCAPCLRERLVVLVNVERIADVAHNNINSVKLSPRPSLAFHGIQSIIKDGHEPIINHGSKPIIANNGHEPIIEHGSKPIINMGFDKPIINNSHEPFISNGHESIIFNSLQPMIINKGYDEPIFSHGSAAENLPGRHSLSSAKGPNLASIENNKNAPTDTNISIASFPVESSKHGSTETKEPNMIPFESSKNCHAHAQIVSKMPPLAAIEHTKLVPIEAKVPSSASSGSNRSNSSSCLGARRSLPFSEPKMEAGKFVENAEIQFSDVSPNPRHRKKTLSSLFSLDDAFGPAVKAKTEEVKKNAQTVFNVKGDAFFDGSSSPPQNTLQVKMKQSFEQKRCKHGSFSERVEPSNYLFPVPEASKPLSWFSLLFRRRKKKLHPKLGESLANFSEHNNGWEDARQSWEAPRPSSWEQLRFSSFEGPRSSWEPARPSWEGCLRTSDVDSVFSGFDFFTESLTEVREDAKLECKGFQELGGDWGNGFADARRVVESKRTGSKCKSVVPKTSHLDDKDRARTFLSAKAMQTQRDVSTQTTPPRSSDATEIFIQQRLQCDHHRHRHYARASHAMWSKVWTKTFSNSKWAFKHKHHHKGQGPKQQGDAAMVIDEAHDQGNTSGRSSFHESTTVESTHHLSHLTHVDNIKEHESCDAYNSPVQKSGDGGGVINHLKVVQQQKTLTLKSDTCTQKDENVDKNRSSSFTLENGLFRFYLTPVRGHGIRGRRKEAIHGL